MNARQSIAKHATTMQTLLIQMQVAANTLPNRAQVDWGHAEQMEDALRHTVYAAFAMGVVGEDEARSLGFPV